MGKRIAISFLAVCLALAALLPSSANAAQASQIIQDVEVKDHSLTVLCADVSQGGEYTLQLDGTQLPFSVGSVDLTRTRVTVLCLVDIQSSSYLKSKLIRETLLEISASLGKDDRMLIATSDDQLTIAEMPVSPEEREAAIGDISFGRKDADLYDGILKSLEQLSSNETYSSCRCLVILSDGDNRKDSTFTQQEVLTAIEKARLPVYTVALAETYTQRQGARILGSFSRSSCGGAALSTIDESGYIRKDSSGTAFGRAIWEGIIGMPVLEADLTGFVADGAKASLCLRVSCTVGDNVYEDTVELASDMFPAPPQAAETAPATSEGDTGLKKEAPKAEKPASSRASFWLWGAVALAVAVTAAVIALVIFRKKRPQSQTAPEAIPEEPVQLAQPEVPSPAETPLPKEAIHHLYLTDIPHGTRKRHYSLREDNPVCFGRDGRADEIINGQDKKLSGTHFSIVAQGGIYRIRDEGSRNGTFLNGVPIAGKGWCQFLSGDKLRAGSYEYRITIEPDRGS